MALGVLVPVLHGSAKPNQKPAQLVKYTETLPNSVIKIQMLPVPAGKIKIGAKTVDVKPFYMASTETVWEAFDLFTSSGKPSPAYDQTKYGPDVVARPSRSYILPDLGWGHHGFPAISLSITNVEMFCRWISSVTKKKYRLPTEAEWEYACRAGTGGPVKMDKSALDKVGWYAGNSKEVTHAVGKKAPNAWGFYDMYGNTGEWAYDLTGKSVVCGATFLDKAEKVLPSARQYWVPDWQDSDPQIPKSRWWLSDGPFCGFRIVCEP